MTYDLYIGDKTFSSWSLRGWLMLEKFDIPYRSHMVSLYDGTMAQDMAKLAPAKLVPTLKTPHGEVIGETLAMAETLAERHPDKALWPADPAARARARWLCAAMTAGFSTLRSECPMQLRHVNKGLPVSDALKTDLARLQELWDYASDASDGNGPWLFGSYSLADVFYAPVCARIIGYDLPVSLSARDYCLVTLNDPAFKTWRAESLKVSYDPVPYDIDCDTSPWPVT
jgi:glutathione S-transferase